MVIFYELGRIIRQWIYNATCQGICTATIVLCALGIELLAEFITGVGIHCVKIALGIYTSHVVHRYCCRCFDTGVDGGCIECYTAPTTDAKDADTFCIHVITGRKVIDCCTEILCIDIRRSYITGFSTAFSCV